MTSNIETIIELLQKNKTYLQKNNFEELFSNLEPKYRADVYEFLYKELGIQPLNYMHTLFPYMFRFYNQKVIEIPDTITDINKAAFDSCESENIILKNPTKIDSQAFSRCPNLKRVEILGGKVSTLPSRTFDNCPSLTYVYFPASVKTLQNGAFNNCNNDLIVVTEYRDTDKLRFKSNELDFYKKVLRFRHAPKQQETIVDSEEVESEATEE